MRHSAHFQCDSDLVVAVGTRGGVGALSVVGRVSTAGLETGMEVDVRLLQCTALERCVGLSTRGMVRLHGRQWNFVLVEALAPGAATLGLVPDGAWALNGRCTPCRSSICAFFQSRCVSVRQISQHHIGLPCCDLSASGI